MRATSSALKKRHFFSVRRTPSPRPRNKEGAGFAPDFASAHGPCLCSMGWLFDDAAAAHAEAVSRGAKNYEGQSPFGLPAIYGIEDSLIHFVDTKSGNHSFATMRLRI